LIRIMNGRDIDIGQRDHWGGRTSFSLQHADRHQHVYIVGKSGTGKSTLVRNMVIQDIEAGQGVGIIDPHGDLALDLLDHIPPSRTRDVIYFNPADRNHPVGFNLLRTVPPDRRHLVASGLVGAFKNVWGDSWGPRLEYILYGCIAALASVENATLLGAQRMLTDERYRRWVLRQVDDPMVRSFWEVEIAGYDKRLLSEAVAPLQNKIGQLVMSPILRNILGQVRSRIDLRFVMDNRRIFIANLSKGHLGEDKANLLGSMLVTAFQLAAMGRADVPEHDRTDWFLYVDEFQSFATDAFASILSEARKYRLSLTLSHQYTSQLEQPIRDAVFGNVGTMVSFRVSESDARILDREFGGHEGLAAFTDLANYEARVRPLVGGLHPNPFLLYTHPPVGNRHGRSSAIIRRSREAFGTPRHRIENRIDRWMNGELRAHRHLRRRR
jgi:energy-coupling factor transporter ATP-binding protein EcfA2